LKLWLVVVGRPGALLRDAIAAYEERAARYWSLEVIEVREEKATRSRADDQIRDAESARLLAKVPSGVQTIALTRTGDAWGSSRLARHLAGMGVQASPGAAFLIGGALGLATETLRRVDRRMRLSTFTLPHDLARLMLAEQLYRAGTIVRNEPYHKGTG
jgi:23S rRNA (pseudouridine1915-N3)-methyltransferase